MICFEKNREFFTQFMAPYTKAYRYMVTELPGITYMEMVADLHMRKSISPYRKNYQAYPNPAVDERIFCFVCNEPSGPFHITLNRNHRNVKLLAEASEYPKVNNLREVIIENIKQRIINSQNHWDKIIDFGGSFVDEWKSDSPMSVQAIWCLERDFAESINRFIALKLSEEERREMGLLGLKFVEEDFQAWWYMPRTR